MKCRRCRIRRVGWKYSVCAVCETKDIVLGMFLVMLVVYGGLLFANL